MSEQTEQRSRQHNGLNRSVNLAAIPLQALAWIVIALFAIGTSLIGRTRWPLGEQESAIARDAWALVQGNDPSAAADAYPAIVQLTAFMFFLFGDTDYTARLVPLLAGVATLGALYWLRGWFGTLAALSIAIVWAISPVMSLSLLRLDGGAILAVASLLTFVLTAWMTVDPARGRAIILGIAVGIGLTAHPLGWLVLPLSAIAAMILIRDVRLGGQAMMTLISALVTVLVITTWWVTRLTAPLDFLSESLGVLWNEQISSPGAVMQAPIITLMIDEFLLTMLSIVGVIILAIRPNWQSSSHPAVVISCIAWALPVLTVGLIAAGKGPDLYAITMFPLVVVAGIGLSLLIDGVRKNLGDNRKPLLWAGIALALIVAIVRFAGLLAPGPEGDLVGWMINIIAVGILILLPLGYLIIRMSAGTGWTYLPVALLTIVVLVGAIGIRTTMLLPDTGQNRPGDLLRAGNTSPGVGSLQHRLRTYSRDATAQTQDVRDPTGSHGLMIVVHHGLADPIAWYFRDFPNLAIVERPEDIPQDTAPDVAFLPAEELDGWEDVFLEHESREYPYRFLDSGEISDNTLNGLILSTANPAEYRDLFEYSIHRSTPAVLEQDTMVMVLREDHVESFWGTGAQTD